MTPSILRAMQRLTQQEQEVSEEHERSTQRLQAAWNAYQKALARDNQVKATAEDNMRKITAKREELNVLFGSKRGRDAAEVREIMKSVQLQVVEEEEELKHQEDDQQEEKQTSVPQKPTKRRAPEKPKSNKESKEETAETDLPKSSRKGRSTTEKLDRAPKTSRMFDSKKNAAAKARSKRQLVSSDEKIITEFQIRNRRSLSTHSEIIVAPRRTNGDQDEVQQDLSQELFPDHDQYGGRQDEVEGLSDLKNGAMFEEQNTDRAMTPGFEDEDQLIGPDESFEDAPTWSFPPDLDVGQTDEPETVSEDMIVDSSPQDQAPLTPASSDIIVQQRERSPREKNSAEVESEVITPDDVDETPQDDTGIASPPPIEWEANHYRQDSSDSLFGEPAPISPAVDDGEGERSRRGSSSSSGLFVSERTPTPPRKRQKMTPKGRKGGQGNGKAEFDIGAAIMTGALSKYKK